MDDQRLREIDDAIEEHESEIAELTEQRNEVTRAHDASIANHLKIIHRLTPGATVRFHYREDWRPSFDALLTRNGGGTLACWVECIGNGREVRVDYVDIDRVEVMA